MSRKIKILWLEDNFDAFYQLVELLSESIDIVNVATREEFYSYSLSDFDGLILDDKIGKDYGIGEEILKSLVGKIDNYKIMFFSAYDLDSVEYCVENHKHNNVTVLVEPKNFTSQFSIYINNLRILISEYFSDYIEGNNVNFYDDMIIDYEGFKNLSYQNQDKIIRNLSIKHEKVVAKAKNEGAIWILIWGDDSDDRIEAFDRSEILSDEQVYILATKKKTVPFIVRNDFSIDDIACSATSRENWECYPTIKFKIKDGISIPFHFDTGSDKSLINAEVIDEYNIQNSAIDTTPRIMPFKIIYDDGRHDQATGIPLLVNMILENPKSLSARFGYTKSVSISGYAIPRWRRSILAVKCNSDCWEGEKDNFICKYRINGLIGRMINKESDNDIDILIRHSAQQVVFLDGDDIK